MSELAEVIQLTQERFNAIAPAYLKYDAEKGFAIQLLSNNSYLRKVAEEAPQSLQQAITNVAAIGLSLNPAEKLAYLIPRNVKIGPSQWQSRIFLEPSYMGLTRLATDSGSIKWVQANCVYAKDSFMDNGPGERPTHTYEAFATAEERGEFKGVYCVAKTQEGDFLTTIMTAAEIYSIRDRSEAWKQNQSGPWKTDPTEQAKKTCVRRGFKMWPRTDERRMAMLAQAVELSNQNEGFEPILTSPEIKDYTADQKAYFDQLLVNNDKLNMFVFLTSIDESVRNNLYHSFEKGTKGKYQRLVDDLYKEGSLVINDLIEAIEEKTRENDSLGVLENIEGLSDDALSIIRERISKDADAMINEHFSN